MSAVQSAVNSAAPGAIVEIPAGTCNWGSGTLKVNAGIHLKGSGKDLTRIKGSTGGYVISFNCSNGNRAVFSDMTLEGTLSPGVEEHGLGLLNGCQDFEVYQSRFTHFTFSALYVGQAEKQCGVIYDNEFIDNYSPPVRNLGYGVVVYGGGTWPALDLGSINAVYVEDNFFSGQRHNIASNNGSRFVFRFNKIVGTDPPKDFAMTDAHGVSSSPRGSRSWEIYDNTYSTKLTSGRQRTAIGMRGGDGVIFNNTIDGATIAYPIELNVEGFGCGQYPGPDQTRVAYIWNNTAGTITNNCPSSIKLGRDYFTTPMPEYKPFPYPHPLRLK